MGKTPVSCPPCIKTRGAGSAEHPPITETTIAILALRPALLAAGVLLSCALAPAHAGQPASRHPECARLRAAILEAEQSERRPRTAMMESVQQDLLILRKRYRKLGCRAPARK